MRLRIQTCSPLPDIKAWFIPDVQSAPESVYDLKEALCLRLQALKARKFSGKDIIMLLDDFELLNDSPFSVVRDGDLICVKLLPLALVETADIEIKPVVGESNITHQRKRKRSPSTMLTIPGRSVRAPTVLPSVTQKATKLADPSDSESDTSSLSSTSSCSSSSSSSSSSTPSCSPSSSSSSSPPKSLTSRPTKQPADTKQPIDNTSRTNPPVPPGFGKPSTHSRNKRRRLKKGYEKEVMSATLSADTPGPPKGSSHTSKLPLGQRKSESGSSCHPPDHTNSLLSAKPPVRLPSDALDTSPVYHLTQQDREGLAADVPYALNNAFGINAQCRDISGIFPKDSQNEHIQDSYITPNQLMMGSLRNKNKKKGFKRSMTNPVPQKIIFTTTTTGSESQQPSSSTQDTLMDEPSTSFGTIQPRLIPPSEIQEFGQLPPNMFVTSVDVESEMWNEHSSYSKKKGKKKALNGGYYPATADWYDSSQMEGGITSEVGENGQFDDADDGSLPYFDTDVQTTALSSVGTTSGTSRPFDWDRAERLWKECTVLEKLEQLVVGCLVGWKGLAINPQTSSPEILLTIARVINFTSISPQNIVIRYLQRPGAGRAALAFGLSSATGSNDEEQVEDDEETFEWTSFLAKQWRVIKL